LQRALHANPVFGTVSEEQLDELCPRMEVWHVREGETVIQQGEKGDSFYVVLSGTFEVLLEQGPAAHPSSPQRSSSEVPVHTYSTPGDGFGELALLYHTRSVVSSSKQ